MRASGIGNGEFNEDAYDEIKIDPSVVIDKNTFDTMKESLAAAIDLEAAGLDNIMMKKMLLSYNAANYLDDTDVLVEISDEDGFTTANAKPFKIIEGDEDKARGENGKEYLTTKGLVTIKKDGKKLIYYPEETLWEIYDKHYVEFINSDNDKKKEYAKSALKYLKKCYTYGGNGIRIFTGVEQEEDTTFTYENIGDTVTVDYGYDYDTYGLTNIEYYSKVAEFATPMEFMVNLLEITASKDFINAFIETVHDKTKINMELKGNSYKEEEEIVVEGTRNNVVTGKKKENYIYTVKRIEGLIEEEKVPTVSDVRLWESGASGGNDIKFTTEGIQATEVVREDEEEADVTVKYDAPVREEEDVAEEGEEETTEEDEEETRCVVVLYKNDNPFKVIELTEENEWTHTWKNLSKPDQREKTKEDTSEIIEKKTRVYEETKYDAVVTTVETWYAKITQENIKNTATITTTVNAKGEQVQALNKDAYEIINLKDRESKFTSDENPGVFKRDADSSGIMDRIGPWTDEKLFNQQFNYVITKPEDDYDPNDYEFTKMVAKDTDLQKHTIKTVTKITYTEGPRKVEDNTEIFLGLLSNEDGKYKLGSKFKSKKSGGKVVKYKDIYIENFDSLYKPFQYTGVGDLLENGAEMLFELLDTSPNTQGLTDVMRYILYLYSGKTIDYGVTELNLIGYGTDDLLNAMGVTGFWWPIGSAATETIDGKLYAKGTPELGKNSITRMGVTGAAYGITKDKHDGNLGLDVSAGGKSGHYNVISIGEGVVTIAMDGVPEGPSSANGGCGNYVAVDYGDGIIVRYLHLYTGSIKVSVGETVKQGQVIGKIGHNGNSTAPHLHMDVNLNGLHVDATQYVDPDNPRPEGVGGISSQLYNFILGFEGGKSAFDPTTKKYTVFNNGIDDCLELTCGAVIGTRKGGLYSWAKTILGRNVGIGDTITQEEYNKIFAVKASGFLKSVDKAIAETGALLNQQQKDAAFSLCWNTGNIKNAISRYASEGDSGYWNYMHDITKSGGKVYDGLVRRRGEEMEMFLDADYNLGTVSEGMKKHENYNIKYGLPKDSGAK